MSPTAAYDALVDGLADVAALLPNVERIEAVSVEEIFATSQTGVIVRRDIWYGRSSAAFIRAVVPAGVASWPVRTSWERALLTVRFELEPHGLPVALHAAGRIVFGEAADATTRIDVDGEVDVGKNPHGVAHRIAGVRAERMIADLLLHNIAEAIRLAEPPSPA